MTCGNLVLFILANPGACGAEFRYRLEINPPTRSNGFGNLEPIDLTVKLSKRLTKVTSDRMAVYVYSLNGSFYGILPITRVVGNEPFGWRA